MKLQLQSFILDSVEFSGDLLFLSLSLHPPPPAISLSHTFPSLTFHFLVLCGVQDIRVVIFIFSRLFYKVILLNHK